MSFEYIDVEGYKMVIEPTGSFKIGTFIGCPGGGVSFDNAEAPRIALEILTAAGYEPDKYQVAIDQHDPAFAALILSNAVMRADEAKAKAERVEKRRDELAAEFTSVSRYSGQLPYTQKLIDRIIELEQS